ncbi:MAG: calcium/sodium antiporter [Phycisphaerales bacterium JB065]
MRFVVTALILVVVGVAAGLLIGGAPLAQIALLGAGIAMLIVGGDVLVRGAVSIADRLKVPAIIVGLTVVAFGTSAPELALNIAAALKGNDELSFGNIVGSNIANVGLILGLSAMVLPLLVNSSVVKRELPMMLLASVMTAGLAIYPFESGEYGHGVLSRIDGAILLAGFVFTMVMIFKSVKNPRGEDGSDISAEIQELQEAVQHQPVWRGLVFIALGLGMLVAGGQVSESAASTIASAMGMSDELIGLTVVAVATSLPELATSLAAIRRGQVDIAVGNVVGSNLFNLLLVLGVTSLIAPVDVPSGGYAALGAMLVLSILLVPMSMTGKRTVSRIEGGILLTIWIGYVSWTVITALNAGGGV